MGTETMELNNIWEWKQRREANIKETILIIISIAGKKKQRKEKVKPKMVPQFKKLESTSVLLKSKVQSSELANTKTIYYIGSHFKNSKP